MGKAKNLNFVRVLSTCLKFCQLVIHQIDIKQHHAIDFILSCVPVLAILQNSQYLHISLIKQLISQTLNLGHRFLGSLQQHNILGMSATEMQDGYFR